MITALPNERPFQVGSVWKDYRPTKLIELPYLAHQVRVDRVFVKNEGERPLGNFKMLGGMAAGLRALARAAGVSGIEELISNDSPRRILPQLICASDGNHGLAVTAAAHRTRSRARIYLPIGASKARADRITALGGQVVRVEGTYDDALRAASAAAASGDGLLLPDTTDDPHDVVVKDVMAGYAVMVKELVSQFRLEIGIYPTHVFVQAGVGGLAAAIAKDFSASMQGPKRIIVVEPEAAGCINRALVARRPVRVPGDLKTSAEMLACGVASAMALEILLRHQVGSILVGEDRLQHAPKLLSESYGPATTPSGAAGLAGLLYVCSDNEMRAKHDLGFDSRVLIIVTEGPLN